MSKEIKQLMIQALAERFRQVEECILVDISTLDSEENFALRESLRDNSITVQGVKAAVARRAFEGLPLQNIQDELKGHSFIATGSTDVVALAKSLVQWAKENEKVVIKGGLFEGRALNAEAIQELSTMPSREELLAGIVSLALGPGGRIASQINCAGANVAGLIKARIEQLEKECA